MGPDRVQAGRSLYNVAVAKTNDAATRVPYRGSWFYIADSDIDSKATFTLLAQFFALSAGEVPSTAPILTLPVGTGSVR
jgi:hypothetical protein